MRKGIQIKVLKIEGLPLNNSVLWTLDFKKDYLPDPKTCSVTPTESVTGRSLIVSSEYPTPDWAHERYYHTVHADSRQSLEAIKAKFYVWGVGGCGAKRIATGHLQPFRETLPGRAVRHTLHLAGETGMVTSGKSVTVQFELLADLDSEDDSVNAAGVAPLATPAPRPRSGNTTAAASAAASADTSPVKPGPVPTSGALSGPPSLQTSPSRSGAGGGATPMILPPSKKQQQQHQPSAANSAAYLADETGMEGGTMDISVLEQRVHILSRQLDRKDRQLMDTRARLNEKTRKFEAVGVDLDDANSRLVDTTTKRDDFKQQLYDTTTKMNAALVSAKTHAAQLSEKEQLLAAVQKELVEQRMEADEAMRGKKAAVEELDTVKLALTNNKALGYPVHHVVSEARIRGLTAELTELHTQLVRGRGRETSLLGDLRTAQQARLGAQRDSESKSAELQEMQRELDHVRSEQSSKAAMILAAAEADAREAREEKDELRKEVDRHFAMLQRAEEQLSAMDDKASERERVSRQADQVVAEMRAAADAALKQSRADIADLQQALDASRDREAQAMRQEKQATSETGKLRMAVQEGERKTQSLESALRSQNEAVDRLRRRIADLEADVHRERSLADNARVQVRDLTDDEVTEVMRLRDMLKVSQDLAQTLAEQLSEMRRERAEADDKHGAEQQRLLAQQQQKALERELAHLQVLQREKRESLQSGVDMVLGEFVPRLVGDTFAALAKADRELRTLRARLAAAEEQRDEIKATHAALLNKGEDEEVEEKDDDTVEAWAQTDAVQFADDFSQENLCPNSPASAQHHRDPAVNLADMQTQSSAVITNESEAQAGVDQNDGQSQSEAVATTDGEAQVQVAVADSESQSEAAAAAAAAADKKEEDDDAANNAPDVEKNEPSE